MQSFEADDNAESYDAIAMGRDLAAEILKWTALLIHRGVNKAKYNSIEVTLSFVIFIIYILRAISHAKCFSFITASW